MNVKFIILLFISSILSYCDSYETKKQKYQSLINEIEIDFNANEYETVIDKSDKALSVFDSLALPHIYKSKAYLALNKTNKAIKEANKAIEIEGDKSKANLILSEIYFHEEEDIDKAIMYAKNFEKHFPENSDKDLLLAQIYYTNHNYKEALKYYTNCINSKHNLAKSLVGRAFTNEKLNNIEQSIEDFEKLKNITTPKMLNYVNFTLGNFYKKNKQYAKSNQAFFQSDSVLSEKYIAQNYVALKKNDSASIHYVKYINVFPNDLLALNENYEILKSLNKNYSDLFDNYIEIKRIEWNSLNWMLKILYICFPILFFGIIFLGITFNNIESEDKKFDRYSFSEGILYSLFAFLFGGAWLYTKNKFSICISIISVIFISRLSFLVFFNYKSDFLTKILFSDKYLIYTILFIGSCLLIDILSLNKRIKNINISIRKKAAKNVESAKRKKIIQEAIYESQNAYNELIELENNSR